VQVFAVKLKQIKGAERRVGIMAKSADQIEDGKALLVADNGLAIDQAGPRRQRAQRRDDLRKAVREVIAFPSEQSHAAFDPAGHDAEAVML
jgi:hypothetical protein